MLGLLAKVGLGGVGSALAPWIFGAVLIGVLALFGAVWKSGYNYRDAKCNAAVIQSKLDAANADLAAEQAARWADKQALDELATEKLKTDTDNDKIRSEIETLPLADQCIITPERAQRMQ